MTDIYKGAEKFLKAGIEDIKKGPGYGEKESDKKSNEIIRHAVLVFAGFYFKDKDTGEELRDFYLSLPFGEKITVSGVRKILEDSGDYETDKKAAKRRPRLFLDIIADFSPADEIDGIVKEERLLEGKSLKEVAAKTGRTQEGIRQRQLKIIRKSLEKNPAREIFPENYIKDHEFLPLLRTFPFPKKAKKQLMTQKSFISARTYFSYTEKKSVKTFTSGLAGYFALYEKNKELLKKLDEDFSPGRYRIYELKGKSRFFGTEDALREILKGREPLSSSELEKEYARFIMENSFPATFGKSSSFFRWNITAYPCVLRTTGGKFRFYDFERYKEDLDAGLEEIGEILARRGKEPFMLKGDVFDEVRDRAESLGIRNGRELHFILKRHYKGKDLSFGKCPTVTGVRCRG